MELFQLRYFVAAAHRLHFTRAAEEMCVSQPSLSQQIANLEREVGAALFTRQGRSVILTDAGRALLRHAERMLEEETLARRAVQEVIGLARGQLTIWTLPTPGQHLLPPLLAEYRRAYPQIAIKLRETVPARAIAEAVEKGVADVGIAHLPYQVEGLQFRELLRENLALVVPQNHAFAAFAAVSLSAAVGEDFIWRPRAQTPRIPSTPRAWRRDSSRTSPVSVAARRACRRWSPPGWESRCCRIWQSMRRKEPASWNSKSRARLEPLPPFGAKRRFPTPPAPSSTSCRRKKGSKPPAALEAQRHGEGNTRGKLDRIYRGSEKTTLLCS